MTNPLRTSEDYEVFLYTLAEQFSSIRRSTLRFVRRGASLARVIGELHFDYNIRMVVRERLVFDCFPAIIDWYGYEVWQNEDKLYWYDSQPHPDVPTLQSTNPHHKHIPPNPKHNRIPTSDMNFNKPNLPFLIREIEILMQKKENKSKSKEN